MIEPAEPTHLFNFVDLFAGIGGFHLALGERGGLGARCVLASEIDPDAREVYTDNFPGTDARGDIRREVVDAHNDPDSPFQIPDHDVLAAGFPCQPFSKSGKQEGLKDATRGTLFFDIATILEMKTPRFIVLENVRNIARHDDGRTWRIMVERLHELGYKVSHRPIVFSPHLLPPDEGGAPQFRERVFILGEHQSYNEHMPLDWDFFVPNEPLQNWDPKRDWDLKQWLKDHEPTEEDLAPFQWREEKRQHALAWGELLSKLPYPGHVPQPLKSYAWKDKPDLRGSDGVDLPTWKQRHNWANSDFYRTYKDQGFIQEWLAKHRPQQWIKSDQKFEWQAQDAPRTRAEDIFELQIQFRPSGLRVKKPTYTGALVAITQTPYMGWLDRKMTPSEAASLQGIPMDWFRLHPTPAVAYKQLGNGVNAGVVRYLVTKLFEHCGYDGFRRGGLGRPEEEPAPRGLVDLDRLDQPPAG